MDLKRNQIGRVQRDCQRLPGYGILVGGNDLSVHEDAQQIILRVVRFEGQAAPGQQGRHARQEAPAR